MNEAELKILNGMIANNIIMEKFWESEIRKYIDNGGERTHKNKEYCELSMRFECVHARKYVLMDFLNRVSRMEEENAKTPERV